MRGSLLVAVLSLLWGCTFDRSGVAPSDAVGGSPELAVDSDLHVSDGVGDARQVGDGDLTLPDQTLADSGDGGADLAEDARADISLDDTQTLPDAKTLPDTQTSPDTQPPCVVWTTTPKHFDPCKIPAPAGGLDLNIPGTWIYDTGKGELKDPGTAVTTPPSVVLPQTVGPNIRVLSVQELKVGVGVILRVKGPNALVVAAWDKITVNGTIDVSSSDALGKGGGANPAGCSSHSADNGGTKNQHGGGGGGGGFGGDGGKGGGGDNGSATGGDNGTKISPPKVVRGGCEGGDGGDKGGKGGDGGGALQLTALVSISIGGTLHAGGKGGDGANSTDRGGGGGGSGGYLGLNAPTITLQSGAILAANGGGGGEGASSSMGNDGADGQAVAAAAAGGGGGSNGSNGTLGGWRDQPNCADASNDDDGGGGGGGGVGFVLYSGNLVKQSAIVTSPNPQPAP